MGFYGGMTSSQNYINPDSKVSYSLARVCQAVKTKLLQDERPMRSTRTKQRMLMTDSEGSDREAITRAAASPRVKELAARTCSPARSRMSPQRTIGYTGKTRRCYYRIILQCRV